MIAEQIWNLVLLSVQVIILIGQLLLSRKINNQTISRDKGYFLIEKTNAYVTKENEGRFRDQFDLLAIKGLVFVLLKGMSY